MTNRRCSLFVKRRPPTKSRRPRSGRIPIHRLRRNYCENVVRRKDWQIIAAVAICSIARHVSKLTKACDKRFRGRGSYIHYTVNNSLESFVGDSDDICHVLVFAGDMVTAKSTSGAYIAFFFCPNTSAPVSGAYCKQPCDFHSSAESEIAAAEHVGRMEQVSAPCVSGSGRE